MSTAQGVVVGLQRSGTTFVETRFEGAGRYRLIRPFWKHSLPREQIFFGGTPIETWLAAHPQVNALVVARHPALWLESILTRFAADLFTTRSIIQKPKAQLTQLACLYRDFYNEWLSASQKLSNIVVIRYEDILQDRFLTVSGEAIPWVERTPVEAPVKVENSVTFHASDREKALGFQCALDPIEVEGFLAQIEADVLNALGYGKVAVKFVTSEKTEARNLLYRIAAARSARACAALTEEEKASLLTHFPNEIATLTVRYVKGERAAELQHEILARFEAALAEEAYDTWETCFPVEIFLQLRDMAVLADAEEIMARYRGADPFVAVMRAEIRCAAGRREEAVAILERVAQCYSEIVRQSSNDKDGHPFGWREDRLTTVFAALSKTLLTLDRPMEALDAASKAVVYAAAQSWAHHYRAESFRRLGALDAAEAAIREAIALSDEVSHHRRILARIHQDRGLAGKALGLVEEAIALNPDDAWAYHQLAEVKSSLKDSAGAIAAMTEAVHRAPEERSFRRQLERLAVAPE